MKIVVLEMNTVGEDIDALSYYEDLGEVVVYPSYENEEQVAIRVEDADIVIANKSPLNQKTLAGATKLKLICELATGYDNVDCSYCRERGIKVCNVKNYSTMSVAQHTILLALMLAENISYYDSYVKSGAYSKENSFTHLGKTITELDGKTWGIIGMGNIGSKVASMAEAMGCRVIFHSVTGTSKCTAYEKVDLPTLLAESDVLSLHCPLSDITRHIINLDTLKQMKKTAILVNVARGAVVDTNDLYVALNEGIIAGAGLDVLENEPIREDNPLNRIVDSNKLIITPHIAWGSKDARIRLLKEVRKNIEAYMRGEDRNIVN